MGTVKCKECIHLDGCRCDRLNVDMASDDYELDCSFFGSKDEKKYDEVNNPQHYTSGGIECIDAMMAARGKEAVIAFCECNAFKYIWRTGKKDDAVQELKKAAWYINKAIELREEGGEE